MATTIGSIEFIAKIDTKAYEAGAERVENANEKMASSTEVAESKSSKMGSVFAKVAKIGTAALAAGAIAAGAAITKNIGGAVKRIDQLIAFPRTLTAMGIPLKEAESATKRLSESLKGLPTPLNEGTAGVQGFVSAGLGAGKATDLFLAMNNALLAGGANAADVQVTMDGMVRAISAGEVPASTLTAMLSRMPTVMSALQKSTGKSRDELIKLYSKDPQSLIDQLIKLNKDGGGGLASLDKQARAATGGISTSVDNMNSAIQRGIQGIVEAIGGGDLEAGQKKISDMITGIGKAFESSLKIIASTIGWLMTNVPIAVKNIKDFGQNTVNRIVEAWSSVQSFFKKIWDNIKTGVTETKDSIVKAFNDSVEAVKDWYKDNETVIKNIGVVIGSFLLPKIIAIGIEFAQAATTAVVSAAVTSAAWLKSAIITAVAWAKSLPGLIAGFAMASGAAIANAARVAAAWAMAALTTISNWSRAFLLYMAGVARAAAATLVAGAKMMVGWLMALGPIGLLIAAVALVAGLIIVNFSRVSKFLSNVWDNVSKGASNSWNSIKAAFSAVGSWFGNVFRGAKNAVQNAFGGIVGFFRGLWGSIKGVFSRISTRIGETMSAGVKGALNSVMGWIQGKINSIIGTINGVIGAVDKITPGGLGRIPKISLPRFAEGGFTGRGAKYDVAGIVHKGEYVIPKELVDQRTGLPKSQSPVGGDSITINVSGVFATSKQEQRAVAETIAERLREISYSKGMA